MTISAQTPRSGPYSGDGSTVAFSYGFLIDDETELVVVVADASGVETVQTLTTNYTVAGVGNDAGGTVTFVTAPSATETVSIRRMTAQDQGTDLQNRGAVVPQVLEDTYDEVVKMVQDLQEQADRAISLRVTSNTTGIDVPAPEADKVLGWNTGGTNLENKTPNTGAFLNLPGASTDNAVVRFNGTGGDNFQNSGVVIDDSGSVALSTINLDNLNTRIGIGDVSPDTDLDIYTAAPTVRLQDSTDDGIVDISYDAAALTIDIDAADLIASSAFSVALDGTTVLTQSDESLDLSVTGSIKVPVGTTAERPAAPVEGDFRRNTTTAAFEGYDGTAWGKVGGGAGLFKGNNGEVGEVEGVGDIFRINAQTLTVDATIDATENASATGPLVVDTGVTLTVTSGGTLAII